jgi:hypothetical protein
VKLTPRARSAALALLIVAGGVALGGCLVASAVKGVGDVAVAGVEVAGKTTVAVAKTTGRVASAAVGSGSADGVKAAAQLARAGLVTFFDPATGAVVRVAWQPGLTLAGAGAAAQVAVAARAVDVIRAGRIAYAATRAARPALPLAAGDVVRLGATG